MEVTQLGRHGIEGRETRKLVLGTHTGTHVDAPRHFLPEGETIDRVPIERFVGGARLIDLRGQAGPIGAESLQAARGYPAVILRYGWEKYQGSVQYFTGHPYLTGPATKFLVKEGVRIIGMDTPSPDASTDSNMPVHKILLESGSVLVEYLVNLGELKSDEFDFFAVPLKIAAGDGSPCRAFAIEG